MKKRLFITMLALLGIAVGARADDVAYAVYNNGTIAFYYDSQSKSRKGTVYLYDEAYIGGYSIPTWAREHKSDIVRAVFDDSFAKATPTKMIYLFYGCENLTTIIGIEKVNTSKVTIFDGMFRFCSKLQGTLDLSSWDTSNVKYMSFMFGECSNLIGLDLSNWDTGNVTDMHGMFERCTSLTSLDVSNWDTGKVTDMNGMFRLCSSLTSLDVSTWNNMFWVSDMSYMFASCSSLTRLDLSNWDTSGVTNMNRMFCYCKKLARIYVGSKWTVAQVLKSEDMFEACSNLVGEKGTKYDKSHIDVSYAHIDGGTANPGYLSSIASYKVYDLTVKGVQVCNENQEDILGDGRVSFDGNKTLTLNKASIYIDEENGFGVYSKIPDLEVVVIGSNVIESKQWTAFSAIKNVHFKGTGTLWLEGYSWGLSCGADATNITVSGGVFLICKGGQRATADNPDLGGGFIGAITGRRPPYKYITTLEVSGANTVLSVIGNGYGSSLYDLKDIVLSDGLKITAPVGAAFDETKHAVCRADGSVVKDAWVIIEKGKALTGDVNGDGSVNVADIGVVIDVMSGKALEYKNAADVNADGSVNVADIGAIIDIMAGKGG